MDYWDRLCKQPVFFLCGKNVMEHSQKVCYNVTSAREPETGLYVAGHACVDSNALARLWRTARK